MAPANAGHLPWNRITPYTITEAAQAAGVSRAVANRAFKAGRMTVAPGYETYKPTMLNASDVRSWIADRRDNPPPVGRPRKQEATS